MRKTEDAGFIVDKAFRSEKWANNYVHEQIRLNRADSLGKLFVMSTHLED